MKINSTGILLIFTILFVFQCSKPEIGVQKESTITPFAQGKVSVIFDAEVLKHQEVGDPSNASLFQLISASPRADRKKINIQIYEDGSSAWVMERTEPKHDVKEHHLTPPDSSSKTQTTRINRNGIASFYDANNTLIRSQKMTLGNFKSIMDEVHENPQAILGAIGIPSAERLKKYLDKAKVEGATVLNLGEGIVSVRTAHSGRHKFNNSSSARIAEPTGNYHSVNIIDTKLNVTVGSTLYDEKEEVVSKAYYRYAIENEKAKPMAIYQEIWSTDAAGKKVKTISNTYFYQFSSTVNN